MASRSRTSAAARLSAPASARASRPARLPETPPQGKLRSIPAGPNRIAALSLESFDFVARAGVLRIGDERVPATLDPAVSLYVVKTALQRGERVIASLDDGRWVILGALRTEATPGVDEGDEFVIRARRVKIEAEHEFAIVSGAASLAVRAQGMVETLADHITSRAAVVQKIIGRVIRLN